MEKEEKAHRRVAGRSWNTPSLPRLGNEFSVAHVLVT